MSKRILHILEATLGGTLRYVENILACTATSDFEMGWVYATGRADHRLQPALAKARSHGWRLFPVDMKRAISPYSDVNCTWQIRRIVGSFKPDVVHCHSSKAGALGRAACATIHPKPHVIYSPHALAAPLGSHYLKIERALAPWTSSFVAVSASEREELIQHQIARREKIDVVYPMIDAQHYLPVECAHARRVLALSENPMIVGVGRLTPQKDPITFLEVVRHLKQLLPDIRAVWVGDGEMREQFLEQRRLCGLDNEVVLAGWQTDVRPFLAAANLLLSTSQFESFGYMVGEALAMARPVVASAVTGTVDILSDDLRRLLYPAGDSVAAAKLIFELIQNTERAAHMGWQGRLNVERRFSEAAMRAALTGAYARVPEKTNRWKAVA